MTRQLVDDTMDYIRKELTTLSQQSHWADGAEAQRLCVRRLRLIAELDRLALVRQTIQIDTSETAAA
jgi:hypothetical protein